jgi:hypothetical protein
MLVGAQTGHVPIAPAQAPVQGRRPSAPAAPHPRPRPQALAMDARGIMQAAKESPRSRASEPTHADKASEKLESLLRKPIPGETPH